MQLAGIKQELDIAAAMQQAILPRKWPDQKEFALWGVMRSAKEVGGDFYDHFALEKGRYGIVVADVSGKGIASQGRLVDVRSGDEQTVEVELRKGISQPLHFMTGASPTERLQITIRDASGAIVLVEELIAPFELAPVLEPGTYQATAVTDSGVETSGTFTTTSEPTVIQIVLK